MLKQIGIGLLAILGALVWFFIGAVAAVHMSHEPSRLSGQEDPVHVQGHGAPQSVFEAE